MQGRGTEGPKEDSRFSGEDQEGASDRNEKERKDRKQQRKELKGKWGRCPGKEKEDARTCSRMKRR